MGAKRSTSLTALILFAVILISINLLSTQFFVRVDLTENRMYTISSSTSQVLRELPDVVNIKAYFSKDLPPYFATLDREVKNLLDEYRSRSQGNVRVEFIDPAEDPETERSVVAQGIPKVQLNVIEQDKAAVTSAFLGIAVQFLDRTEVIPVVRNVDNLEYDLTASILKVTGETQTVGFEFPPGMNFSQGFQGIHQVLEQQYNLIEVDLAQPVPEEVNTLVVFDQDGFTDMHLYHLDQFLMSGGGVFVLASGVQVPPGSLSATNREVKLDKLLSLYGVKVEQALIADAQCGVATFSQGYMQVSMAYPWWPQFTGEGLSDRHPATADMDAVILPWPSPVRATPDSGAVEAVPLLTSSPRSFAARQPYNLNPRVNPQPPGGVFQPQPAAVALSGTFRSYFAGRPAPGDTLGTTTGPELSPRTQLAVVGNDMFLQDRFLGQFPSNPTFAANLVDWMTLGNELIAIRSRTGNMRPLEDVEDDRRATLKWLGILGMPVVVILGGLVRLRLRRDRRRRLAEFYGGGSR